MGYGISECASGQGGDVLHSLGDYIRRPLAGTCDSDHRLPSVAPQLELYVAAGIAD